MKAAAIIQARNGSSRLPGKANVLICGKPALQRVIERLRAAKTLDDIIIATTTNEKDDPIIDLCESLGCSYFRGSEEDVLSRVLEAARQFGVDVIVEVTADCPLLDWNHVDSLVQQHLANNCDMTSNIIERTFPRGYDLRVFNREVLEQVNQEVDNPVDRQHVSTWMYLNPKAKGNYLIQNWMAHPEQNRPDIEVTLDTPEDLELIRFIYGFESQGYNLALTCEEVINIIDSYPDVYTKVGSVQRKDYFAELEECYAFLGFVEDKILNGNPTRTEEPIGIFSENEKSQQISNEEAKAVLDKVENVNLFRTTEEHKKSWNSKRK